MKQYAYVTHSGAKGTFEAENDLAALKELNDRFGISKYSLQVLSGDPPNVHERMVINHRQTGNKYSDFWDRVRLRSQGIRS